MRRPRPLEAAGWLALAALFSALLVGVVTFDPRAWPSPVGDESTYQMAAASLAHDLDLRYSRADYDRFVAEQGRRPEGLILQSRDRGAHLVYGKPFLYPLAIAPFVLVAPIHGPLVANVLFLAVAVLLTLRTLAAWLGEMAPWWVAVLVFASVTFAYVFWVHPGIFLLAATAAAYALAYGGGPKPAEGLPQVYDAGPAAASPGRFVARWLAVGILLGLPLAVRPLYLPLALPLALAVPARRRGAGLAALAVGVAFVLGATFAVQWASGGSWSAYGGERQGFYAHTGFPEVDFPGDRWESSVERWGNSSWIHPGALDVVRNPRLWGWDAVYFLVGRNVGVLAYFLPLVLGFVAFHGERGRWAVVPAILMSTAAFVVAMPFNFYGGGGAIGNRYFLPLYPALWFLVARPLNRGRAAFSAIVVAAVAAPLLWPLWTAPRAFPVGRDGRYHHVSALASRFLPYETSQSHLPGGHDTSQNGLWIRFLSPGAGPGPDRYLRLSAHAGGAPAEVLVGSPRPLERLRLEVRGPAPTRLEVEGAEVGQRLFRPDGSAGFDLLLGEPRARHPMWWTRDPVYLYRLGLALPRGVPGPVSWELLPGETAEKYR